MNLVSFLSVDSTNITWYLCVVEDGFVENASFFVQAGLGIEPHGQGVLVVVHFEVDFQDASKLGLLELQTRLHTLTVGQEILEVEQGT